MAPAIGSGVESEVAPEESEPYQGNESTNTDNRCRQRLDRAAVLCSGSCGEHAGADYHEDRYQIDQESPGAQLSRARGGLTLWVKGALCRVLNPMLAINREIATVVGSAVHAYKPQQQSDPR